MPDLRDLDQRFLSAAAPKAARVVDGATARSRAAARTARGLAHDLDLRELGALDEKYAARGLLGFFRDVPQLMAVVIGLVFTFGTLVAAHELRDQQTRGDDQTVVDGGPVLPGELPTAGTLGPKVGSSVPAYLTTSAKGLAAAAAKAPDDRRLTLVSLSSYYRPEQAASILSGYVVERTYLRAGSAGKEAPQLPLDIEGDYLTALKAFYARTAKGQRDAAAQYQELADTTSNDPTYKAFYTQFAVLSRKQSQAFGGNCACVFSAIVKATPTQLLSLRSRPGIRSVEVAGPGLGPADLDIVPLLPEVKGVVPEPTLPEPPPS